MGHEDSPADVEVVDFVVIFYCDVTQSFDDLHSCIVHQDIDLQLSARA